MEPHEFRKYSRLGAKGIKIILIWELKAFWTNRSIIISLLITPIVYYLFLINGIGTQMGSIFYMGKNLTYAQYAFAGLIGFFIVAQMSQTIYRTTIDKRWGFLHLKFYSGITSKSYILGMSIYGVIEFFIQSIMLLIIVLIFAEKISILSFIICMPIIMVSLLFWSCLGTLFVLKIKNYQQRDMIVSLSILPLSFSAPAFFVYEEAPKYIRYIASINPLTYQLRSLRSILFDVNDWKAIIINVVLTVILFLITILLLRNVDLSSSEK